MSFWRQRYGVTCPEWNGREVMACFGCKVSRWIPCRHTFSWRKGPDTCKIGNLSSLSLPSEPIETFPCEICASGRLEVFGGKYVWQTVRRKLFTRNWRIGIGPLALGSVAGNWAIAELCSWKKRGIWKAACIAGEGRSKHLYFPAFSHRLLGSAALGDHLAASAKTKDSKYPAPRGESAIAVNQIQAVGSKGCVYRVCGAVGAGRQVAPQLRWEASQGELCSSPG